MKKQFSPPRKTGYPRPVDPSIPPARRVLSPAEFADYRRLSRLCSDCAIWALILFCLAALTIWAASTAPKDGLREGIQVLAAGFFIFGACCTGALIVNFLNILTNYGDAELPQDDPPVPPCP